MTIAMLGARRDPRHGRLHRQVPADPRARSTATTPGSAIVLVIGSMISLGYYLRVVAAIWMRPPVAVRCPGRRPAGPRAAWRRSPAARSRPTSGRTGEPAAAGAASRYPEVVVVAVVFAAATVVLRHLPRRRCSIWLRTRRTRFPGCSKAPAAALMRPGRAPGQQVLHVMHGPTGVPAGRAATLVRPCSIRSRASARPSVSGSAPTSRTSTGPCSRSSTCPRRSRGRCSRATRAIRERCDGCSWTSSPAICPSRTGRRTARAAEGERAAELYERIFLGYGDDSVAQLGGAHVACEWVSNVLTKILQRPRLAAYLEQSTRYIAYDAPMPDRPGGYRYYRDPELGPRVRARDGRAVRDLRGGARRASAPGRSASSREPATSPRPRTRARSRPRRSICCAGCCRPARSRTWASSPAARPTSS